MNAEALRARSVGLKTSRPPLPYPGLRPFTPGEWQIYFGREAMADEVIRRLIHQDLLVVHGDSGCGKSSLIYAGVLPVLEQQSARSDFHWRTCYTTPGDQPVENLVGALLELCPGGNQEERAFEIKRALTYGQDSAGEVASLVRTGPDDHICILLDQFEELFAHAHQHDPHEAQQVVDFLIGLHRNRGDGLHAILTMRSEFLGSCAQYRDFAETVNETQYLLPRMKPADLLRAICEPARLCGGQIERALAERLIQETGATQDQLPLIQHGLMKLHRIHTIEAPGAGAKARDSVDGWTLTLKQYVDGEKDLGELLSTHASDLAAEAERDVFPGKESPRVVENLFRALTTIDADGRAVRRPQTLRQLVAVTGASEKDLKAVIARFRAEGVSFLRPFGDRPLTLDDQVDISHEALIRCWDSLSNRKTGWLFDEFRSGLLWRSLQEQARKFDPARPEFLSAATLPEREKWLSQRNAAWAERYGGGWDEVRRLADASALEATRRERMARRTLVALTVLLLATAVAGIFAAVAWQRAENAEIQANNAAKEAVVSATNAIDAKRATQLALDDSEKQKQLLEEISDQNLRLKSDLEQALNVATNSTLKAQLSAVSQREQDRLDAALAPLAARVYLQISQDSQRDTARQFATRIGQLKLNGSFLVAPGVELKANAKNELRCFSDEDCKEADALLKALSTVLVAPALTVSDLSRRYEGSKNIRARHYEVWFAEGPLTLAP